MHMTLVHEGADDRPLYVSNKFSTLVYGCDLCLGTLTSACAVLVHDSFVR